MCVSELRWRKSAMSLLGFICVVYRHFNELDLVGTRVCLPGEVL